MGDGAWGMGHGAWGTGNGERGTGNGERGTGNGEWGTGDGKKCRDDPLGRLHLCDISTYGTSLRGELVAFFHGHIVMSRPK